MEKLLQLATSMQICLSTRSIKNLFLRMFVQQFSVCIVVMKQQASAGKTYPFSVPFSSSKNRCKGCGFIGKHSSWLGMMYLSMKTHYFLITLSIILTWTHLCPWWLPTNCFSQAALQWKSFLLTGMLQLFSTWLPLGKQPRLKNTLPFVSTSFDSGVLLKHIEPSIIASILHVLLLYSEAVHLHSFRCVYMWP